MPVEIKVTKEDIAYAEKILLPEGKSFDAERKKYIRDFRTLDLQAVPGSGKTTALLAKLLILERKLPFSDGSGILIISHTNAAVDEIKEKLYRHCPRLFAYPNFIGTIQSFVDTFLAIPFYTSKNKKKPLRIDNEIYGEKIDWYLNNLWSSKFGFPDDLIKKIAHIKNATPDIFHNYRFRIDDNVVILTDNENYSKLEISKPKGNTKKENYKDYTAEEKESVYGWFKELKIKILKDGILNFDDAYFLAENYIRKIPKIKAILQQRFAYVFVDEMQDMDNRQYDLLEKLFYDDGCLSVIQRIGDKNQAIHNSVKTAADWRDRKTILKITGSPRLSGPIAKIVEKFALHAGENFEIKGLNDCEIKPHIIVFEDTKDIMPGFTEILRTYETSGKLSCEGKNIKAVCWNTEWKNQKDIADKSKLRLTDYCAGFSKDKQVPKLDHSQLKNYLIADDKYKSLSHIRKNILNALLKVLRLENITGASDRNFTKKTLLNYIKTDHEDHYNILNQNLYLWSIGIVREDVDGVWQEIKKYIPSLLALFRKGPLSNISGVFVNEDSRDAGSKNTSKSAAPSNIYVNGNLSIEYTSVHAVKGQTHYATLYLESFYEKGYGNYESERLRNQFLATQTVAETLASLANSRELVAQSSKMAYVGFSRPTHFLCVAIHKARYEQYLKGISQDLWEIKTL
ncbi:MAG: hypothetical protein DI539_05735 [Flavobacterium psychrophilum]|nr:MAG: hypothetical protein DI539_05735 [Flavobacterium psychrophilum]